MLPLGSCIVLDHIRWILFCPRWGGLEFFSLDCNKCKDVFNICLVQQNGSQPWGIDVLMIFFSVYDYSNSVPGESSFCRTLLRACSGLGCILILVQNIKHFISSWAQRAAAAVPRGLKALNKLCIQNFYLALLHLNSLCVFPLCFLKEWSNIFLRLLHLKHWSSDPATPAASISFQKFIWQLNAIRTAHGSLFNLTQMGSPNCAKKAWWTLYCD